VARTDWDEEVKRGIERNSLEAKRQGLHADYAASRKRVDRYEIADVFSHSHPLSHVVGFIVNICWFPKR